MSSVLEKAKTQKHFCFMRSLPSDYDVVISAKAREVGFVNTHTTANAIYMYRSGIFLEIFQRGDDQLKTTT